MEEMMEACQRLYEVDQKCSYMCLNMFLIDIQAIYYVQDFGKITLCQDEWQQIVLSIYSEHFYCEKKIYFFFTN